MKKKLPQNSPGKTHGSEKLISPGTIWRLWRE